MGRRAKDPEQKKAEKRERNRLDYARRKTATAATAGPSITTTAAAAAPVTSSSGGLPPQPLIVALRSSSSDQIIAHRPRTRSQTPKEQSTEPHTRGAPASIQTINSVAEEPKTLFSRLEISTSRDTTYNLPLQVSAVSQPSHPIATHHSSPWVQQSPPRTTTPAHSPGPQIPPYNPTDTGSQGPRSPTLLPLLPTEGPPGPPSPDIILSTGQPPPEHTNTPTGFGPNHPTPHEADEVGTPNNYTPDHPAAHSASDFHRGVDDADDADTDDDQGIQTSVRHGRLSPIDKSPEVDSRSQTLSGGNEDQDPGDFLNVDNFGPAHYSTNLQDTGAPADTVTGYNSPARPVGPSDLDALACLQKAWAPFCDCDEMQAYNRKVRNARRRNPILAQPTRDYTLDNMTDYWDTLLRPFRADTGKQSWPLAEPALLDRTRDPKGNTYTDIPWQQLLAGPENHIPVLSFQKSEEEHLSDPGTTGLTIHRSWDIDSVLFSTQNLGIHRNGFNLAYRPPFLRRLTQNPKVEFRGHAIETLKNMRIGQGISASAYNYECHVFFPHLPVSETTHLQDSEQELWINQIVLPALRATCPPSVLQHHPRSFQEGCTKANVRSEQYDQGSHQAMDIRYTVPEAYCRAFSEHLISLANSPNALTQQFGGLFFVVSGHDQKLHTSQPTPGACRRLFLSQFAAAFSCEVASLTESWVDFGMEDTPHTFSRSAATTLLRKTTCLDRWMKRFRSPESSVEHLLKSRYSWGATSLAGTASVAMNTDSNGWYSQGLLAYHKAYNLHKDTLATPFKGYGIFDNGGFEALPLRQDLLEQWGKANSRYGRGVSSQKRQNLKDAFQRSKDRLATACEDTKTTNFGARQEYRISLALFTRLDLNDELEYNTTRVWPSPDLDAESASANADWQGAAEANGEAPTAGTADVRAALGRPQAAFTLTAVNLGTASTLTAANAGPERNSLRGGRYEADGSTLYTGQHFISNPGGTAHGVPENEHLPYWVLSTKHVNAYLSAQMNRWVLLIEYLADRAECRPGSPAAQPQEQLINILLGAAAARMLRLSTCSFISSSRRELWQDFWFPKTRPTADEDDDVDDESADEKRLLGRRHPKARWGLNAGSTILCTGTPWLPTDSCLWHVPTFKPEWARRVELADNGFGAGFTKTKDIHAQLQADDYAARYLEHLLKRCIQNDPSPRVYTQEAWDQRPDATKTTYVKQMAQVVVMYYIREVWDTLLSRGPGLRKTSRTTAQLQSDEFFRHLQPRELRGTAGLTPEMVGRVLRANPRIIATRPSRNRAPQHGTSYFPGCTKNTWYDKVKPLFLINDNPRKARAWDRSPYRILTRQIYAMFTLYTSQVVADHFLNAVYLLASLHLWIIPQWDIDHFSVLYKASKHHHQATQADIAVMTPLERTQWLCPAFPSILKRQIGYLNTHIPDNSGADAGWGYLAARRAIMQYVRGNATALVDRPCYSEDAGDEIEAVIFQPTKLDRLPTALDHAERHDLVLHRYKTCPNTDSADEEEPEESNTFSDDDDISVPDIENPLTAHGHTYQGPQRKRVVVIEISSDSDN